MIMQSRQWLPLMTAVLFVLSTSPASAQKTSAISAPIGMPQDWSHRHVVYSNPDTPEEAAKKGQTAKWRKNYRDPRFVLALGRKLESKAAAKGPTPLIPRQPWRNKPLPQLTESGIHRDWSNVMGGGTNGLGGVGTAGVYPAKYSFDIYATPSCANDFVVYPTSTAGATSTGAAETRTSNMSGGDPVGTITIGAAGTARSIVLTASGTLNTGQNFLNTGTDAQQAASLAAAVTRWSGQTGITATSSGVNVVFARISNSNTVNIPITNGLSNYTVGAATAGSGTAGQPTIIAFNQLYNTTCTATRTLANAPNVFWSYNTGANAVVRTSPVISYYDGGKQVAFIQSTGGVASLVLLKWSSTAPGTAGAPTALTSQTLANYRSCTAPCMAVIPFSGSPDNLVSSPYIDYYGDVAWVGASNGTLHKFTGIFAGTPAEVTTGGFPATVSAGNRLSSPVYDFSAGQVFVGSASGGAGLGGMLHRVNGTTGALVSSAKLTTDSNLGILASPVIDSSAGRAYVFVYAGNGGTGANCTIAICRAVVQFNTSFAAANAGTRVIVGAGNDTAGQQYIGTFDDAYYSSPTPDGALYVAAGDPTQQWVTVLWKIPITSNVMGTPIRGATISGNDTTAGSYTSPISEVKNGTNDYLYVGVHDFATDGTATVCGTGLVGSACLYMFNLSDLNGTAPGTGDPWGTANVPSAGLTVFDGTGGIIMDNISVVPGTSQVYFSNLRSPGNAYQASQDGLQ